MNIKRFHAATSREALAKARMAFGDGTLILSNRATANGVEVVATAEDTLHALDQDSAPSARPALQPMQTSEEPRRPAPTPSTRSEPTPSPAPARRSIEADTEQLAMSTLSFQDYVRERMLRRRHEAMHGTPPAAKAEPALPERLPTFAERARDSQPEHTRGFAPEPQPRAREFAPERARA